MTSLKKTPNIAYLLYTPIRKTKMLEWVFLSLDYDEYRYCLSIPQSSTAKHTRKTAFQRGIIDNGRYIFGLSKRNSFKGIQV